MIFYIIYILSAITTIALLVDIAKVVKPLMKEKEATHSKLTAICVLLLVSMLPIVNLLICYACLCQREKIIDMVIKDNEQ